jgi:hypothetical protein
MSLRKDGKDIGDLLHYKDYALEYGHGNTQRNSDYTKSMLSKFKQDLNSSVI